MVRALTADDPDDARPKLCALPDSMGAFARLLHWSEARHPEEVDRARRRATPPNTRRDTAA